MNQVINSQVQSPLVRALENVPTKAGSFTHHIPDNMPPVSTTKITIAASSVSGSNNGWNSKYTFNIPQYGFLHRAVLKYTIAVGSTGSVIDEPNHGYSLTGDVQLSTRNRPVQRMHGLTMYARAKNSGYSHAQRLLKMNKFHDVHRGTVMPATAALTLSNTYASYVELPLASTMTPAHNFNTRFVEPLQLKVDTKDVAVLNALAPVAELPLQVELLLYFLNYHDLTEQDIRNANYKPDSPAVVFAYDEVAESEAKTANNMADGVVQTVTTDIRSRNLMYGMLLYAYKDTVLVSRRRTLDLGTVQGVSFAAAGQEIYAGNTVEIELVDRLQNLLSTFDNHGTTASDTTVTSGFGSSPAYRLTFPQLSTSESYNSGCVGLQTLSNPQIVTTFTGVTGNKLFGAKALVVCHIMYHCLVQIDPNTGAITRSMDN